jgi:hypothetical protein
MAVIVKLKKYYKTAYITAFLFIFILKRIRNIVKQTCKADKTEESSYLL